ncbi:hypothetical protein [Nonomuraea sp. 10N515B]|uniref:hypothetical protein n=1 Tax=Nonomuraea sp. 10N515B TaxID=3457422 RepID=UPI003FCDB0EA
MTGAARASRYLVAAVTVALALSSCGRQPAWFDIESATISPDGKTINATILTMRPDSQGNSCEEITGQTVSEYAAEVAIGIEVRDNCEPLFPWEEGIDTTDFGHARTIQLRLKSPLGDRRLVDLATQQEVPIFE